MTETTRPDLSSFELVVFDNDGVLVDSERLTVGVEAQLLTDLGWSMTTQEVVRRWMGRSPAQQHDDVAVRLGPDVAREFTARLTRELTRRFDEELTEVSGVGDLLGRLHDQGVPVCVASSGSPEHTRHKLDVTGLRHWFGDDVFSAAQVPRGKPDPDLFLFAAERMGVVPIRCAVVEDSLPGVRAAVASGMTAYGFAGGYADPGELAEAGAWLFDRMADLG